MTPATFFVLLVILVLVGTVIGRGIYNKLHNKGGCGCGCSHCPSKGMCHPTE